MAEDSEYDNRDILNRFQLFSYSILHIHMYRFKEKLQQFKCFVTRLHQYSIQSISSSILMKACTKMLQWE